MIVGWPGLGGLAAAFRGRRKGTRGRTRLAQLGLLALLAASVLVGFSGCGGSSSVAPGQFRHPDHGDAIGLG